MPGHTFVGKYRKENFYHGILLGLLGFKDSWGVWSNRESGDGYSDILVEIEEKDLTSLRQIFQIPQEFLQIKRNRTPNMYQLIRRSLHPFLRHKFLFIKLLPRPQPSSCQDRNNFFLKNIFNDELLHFPQNKHTKKELLISQKPFN